MFQSSSGQKAGCNPGCLGHIPAGLAVFQSSSGQKAGCNLSQYPVRTQVDVVSILIRPEGRMQPYPGPAPRAARCWFQSSSGQKAGCNSIWPEGVRLVSRVSILIRPEGRMQLLRAVRSRWLLAIVSILIRPEGRMQHPMERDDAHLIEFQSSSGQKAGCNGLVARLQKRIESVSILIRPEGRMQLLLKASLYDEGWLFQSSSGQKAGCNLGDEDSPALLGVSILIRPEGRMQLYEHPDLDHAVVVSILIRPEGRMQRCWSVISGSSLFVSILIRPEGRMQRLSGPSGCPRTRCFNPHPARRPDATGISSGARRLAIGFNPHPARRPDATRYRSSSGVVQDVSILIRPEGRMQH